MRADHLQSPSLQKMSPLIGPEGAKSSHITGRESPHALGYGLPGETPSEQDMRCLLMTRGEPEAFDWLAPGDG